MTMRRGPQSYYVYILTNNSGTLYTGVTNDLVRRLTEHRQSRPNSFTSRYKVGRLVYYEETSDVLSAIEREKQIKGWLRSKKVALIKSLNPLWKDLSEGWFDKTPESLAMLERGSRRPE